jgi:hypothetical protein
MIRAYPTVVLVVIRGLFCVAGFMRMTRVCGFTVVVYFGCITIIIYMDSVCVEVEPNRNAEAYRNYQPVALPAQVEKYLDVMEICEGK